MFRLDASFDTARKLKFLHNLLNELPTMIDTAITQNYEFFCVFTKHILPRLNLEEWYCFLRTTKKLWDVRHKFDPLCLKLRNYKNFLKEMPA